MFIEISSMEFYHGYIEVRDTTCIGDILKMLVTVLVILVTNITVVFHYSRRAKVVVLRVVITRKYGANLVS